MTTNTKKERYAQYNTGMKDVLRNYSMEIKAARRSPKVYYSKDGKLKAVK